MEVRLYDGLGWQTAAIAAASLDSGIGAAVTQRSARRDDGITRFRRTQQQGPNSSTRAYPTQPRNGYACCASPRARLSSRSVDALKLTSRSSRACAPISVRSSSKASSTEPCNGHFWLAAELSKRKIPYRLADNAFAAMGHRQLHPSPAHRRRPAGPGPARQTGGLRPPLWSGDCRLGDDLSLEHRPGRVFHRHHL